MARKPVEKKKNTRIAAGPAAPSVAYGLGETAGRVIRPLIPLALFALLYAGVAVALWLPLRKDAKAVLSAEQLMQPRLNAAQRPPAWVNAAERKKIAQLGLAVEGRSVFEPGVAAELAKAYATSPWIERVGAVRVRYPAVVQLEEPQWRTPFARVETDTSPMVLDKRGFVMPLAAEDLAVTGGRAGASHRELPSITGFRCARIEPGQQVSEPQAFEGLELLHALQDALQQTPGGPKPSRVQCDAAGAWRVWLLNGPVVEWGFWNDDLRHVNEPARREKQQALAQFLAQCDPARLREIKVNVPEPAFVPR